jgi:regulatory protein
LTDYTSELLDLEAAGVRYLAAREHSRFELTQRLVKKTQNTALIDRLLNDFERRGLLSDERFTEQYVQMRTRRGYGPLRIRDELRQRGVDQSLVDEWIDINGSEWRAQIAEVAAHKFGSERAIEAKEQAKRARFLQYRGFPENLIRRYLWD